MTAKNDMERVGLFSELGYVSSGDKYPSVDPTSRPFNASAYKNKQMLPGGTKTRSTGLQTGYFEPTFKRIMENEAYSDPVKNRRQERAKQSKKNLGGAFVPSSHSKSFAGAGNHYGTFGGVVKHFSAESRGREKYQKEKVNFLTNPGRKGTGYGYLGVTLGKYQEHAVEPYDRAREIRRKEVSLHKGQMRGGPFKLNSHAKDVFDSDIYKGDRMISKPKITNKSNVKPFRYASPGKHSAGCKAGTFNTYPEHSVDSYGKKSVKKVTTNSSGKLYNHNSGPKSKPQPSIMSKNVTLAMNQNNYKSIRSVTAY